MYISNYGNQNILPVYKSSKITGAKALNQLDKMIVEMSVCLEVIGAKEKKYLQHENFIFACDSICE